MELAWPAYLGFVRLTPSPAPPVAAFRLTDSLGLENKRKSQHLVG